MIENIDLSEIAITSSADIFVGENPSSGFSLDDIKDNWKLGKRFVPQMGTEERGRLCSNWSKAVERSRNWEKEIA